LSNHAFEGTAGTVEVKHKIGLEEHPITRPDQVSHRIPSRSPKMIRVQAHEAE